MAIRRDDFPLPDVDDPLTAPYFAGAARGELMITRCDACDEYVWYPQEQCPTCAGPLTWTAVSGAGTLFSWAIVRRAFLPAFADQVPFVTALVAIVEDPAVRLPTYLVDADPEIVARRRAGAGDVPPAVVLDGARQVGDRPDVRARRSGDLRRRARRRSHRRDRGRVLRQAADRPRRRRGVRDADRRSAVHLSPHVAAPRRRPRSVARGGRHRDRRASRALRPTGATRS